MKKRNSKKKRKSKRKSKWKSKRNSKRKRNPNWLELPEDVWFAILSKLKTIDVIENAQKVCMLFRKLCKHPSMFMKIDMSFFPDAFNSLPYDAYLMTEFAVDRSAGQLIDINLEYLCDDATLLYIAQRSPNLRHLRLGHNTYVSDEGLSEAVQKLPMLEELQLIICSISDEAVKAVGHALPALRSFSLTQVGSKNKSWIGYNDNEAALAISTSMPDLRHLQLIGSNMTNEGLKAILDGCPLLESLDIRACFQIDLSGDLGKICKAIKHLRLPHDSTQDYGRQAYVEQEGFGYDSDDEDSDDDLEDEYSDDEDSDDDLEDEYSDDEDSDGDFEDQDSDDDLEVEDSEDEDSGDDFEDEDSDGNLEDEDSDDDLEDEDSEDEDSDDDFEDEDSDDGDSDDEDSYV